MKLTDEQIDKTTEYVQTYLDGQQMSLPQELRVTVHNYWATGIDTLIEACRAYVADGEHRALTKSEVEAYSVVIEQSNKPYRLTPGRNTAGS